MPEQEAPATPPIPANALTPPQSAPLGPSEIRERARALRGDYAALIEELLDPVGGISQAVEQALLGTHFVEVGLTAEDLDVKKIQTRLIEHLFEEAEGQVQNGLRDEYRTRALMDLLLNLIGSRIMGVLAQKRQITEDRVEAQSWFRIPFKKTAAEKELDGVKEVTHSLRWRVNQLRGELTESFLLDKDVPEEVRQAHEMKKILDELYQAVDHAQHHYWSVGYSKGVVKESKESKKLYAEVLSKLETLRAFEGTNDVLDEIFAMDPLQTFQITANDGKIPVAYNLEDYFPYAKAYYERLEALVDRLRKQVKRSIEQYERARMADYLRSLEALKIEPRPERERVPRKL